MNIFISYNHKDQKTAGKIHETLVDAGFKVTIDKDNLKPGQAIENFITDSIRHTDATLILISRNSLASAWVALESILGSQDELLRLRKIIPCYLDADFLERPFTSKVIGGIDQNLYEINHLIHAAVDKGDGIEDLQNERTRLSLHKSRLPSIIQRLRETLCIDLTDENFEWGIKKIIAELTSENYKSGAISQNTIEVIRNKQIDGKPRQINSPQTASPPVFIQTDWDNLLSEIRRGNCTLFLGHGLLTDANGIPMYKHICDKLATELKPLLHKYYPEENFFLFHELKNRRKFSNRIENFYKNLQPDLEIYRMLAEIPVSLYISVSPDTFLQKALGDQVNVSFFNDSRKKGNDIEASINKPLLYNIFGSIQDSGSLLLSHDDLFDFFKDIFSGQGLPTAVKKFFREDAGGEVIFLGFTFSKWYVQLLLRLFNLTKNNELSRTAYLHHNTLEDDVAFANQHFRVEFIETQIHEFVYELHKRCKENNLLRNLKSEQQAVGPKSTENKEDQISKATLRLKKCHEIRQQFELSRILEDDPKQKIKYERDIENLEKEISKLSQELLKLSV